MSNKVQLSVVIPAYNAEMTLKTAVESAVIQSDESLEVIIINDGSEDGTSIVAEKLSRRWENVSLINTDNRGVSHARNMGIKNAAGKWVLFLDADDELKQSVYSILCSLMLHDEFDIIFGMKEYLAPDKKSCYIHKELSEIGDQLTSIACVEVLESLLSITEDSLSGSCTRALYRREWLVNNDIRFPEGVRLGEDKCFLMDCMLSSPRIARVGILFYRANQNLASVTRGYITELETSVQCMRIFTERVVEMYPGLEYLLEPNMAQSAWLLIDNSAKRNFSHAIYSAKKVFSSDSMRSAIRSAESTDCKVNRRMKLLRLGLLAYWMPAAVLRCKRRFEGF